MKAGVSVESDLQKTKVDIRDAKVLRGINGYYAGIIMEDKSVVRLSGYYRSKKLVDKIISEGRFYNETYYKEYENGGRIYFSAVPDEEMDQLTRNMYDGFCGSCNQYVFKGAGTYVNGMILCKNCERKSTGHYFGEDFWE